MADLSTFDRRVMLLSIANRLGAGLSTDLTLYDERVVLAAIDSAAATVTVTPALGVLRAALAQRNSTPCRIVFAGSSTTAGTGASDTAHAYAWVFTDALQAAYPSDTGTDPALIASTSATWGTPSTDHGVHAYNLGEGGTASANYFTAGERTSTAALSPACIIHMIGANDFSTGVAPETYSANVLAVIEALKTAVTTPLVQVLAHTYQRMDVADPAYPWSDYGDALQAIATADPDNVVFVDCSAVYALCGVPGTDPWNLIGGDNIHQGDAGHALTADLLWQGIIGSSRALPATSLPLALVLSVAPAITGTPEVGQELTVSAGTWSATPDTTAYQWLRDGAVIADATAATYTLVEADDETDITCRVSVAKAGYMSAVALSDAVTVSTGSPTVLVSDTFTRADAETLGNAETGGAWTLVSGAFAISSNAAVTTAANALATIDCGAADIDITGDITHNGAANPAGITYRVISAAQRLTTCITATAISIWIGASQVAAHAETINTSVPHTVRTVVNGNQIDAYLDGAESPNVSYTLTGDNATTYASATGVGLRCNDTTVVGVAFDNFEVTAL